VAGWTAGGAIVRAMSLPVPDPAWTESVPGAQTADRVLQLLVAAAHTDHPLDLSEFSEMAGLNKAVTRRLVQALMKHGLLARHPDGRRYTIGSGLVALSANVMGQTSIREAALPVMAELSAATSETVSLHVRHLRMRVCVAVVDGIHPVRWVVALGEALPLYVGLSGWAILAHLDESEIAAVLDDAAASGVDRTQITSGLARVRSQGYLAEVGARVPGLAGLSAPVFDGAGRPSALTISGPGDRFTVEVAEEMAPLLLELSTRISMAMGHPGVLSSAH
jgi:IclR family KDG regulon transcriptional repressor